MQETQTGRRDRQVGETDRQNASRTDRQVVQTGSRDSQVGQTDDQERQTGRRGRPVVKTATQHRHVGETDRWERQTYTRTDRQDRQNRQTRREDRQVEEKKLVVYLQDELLQEEQHEGSERQDFLLGGPGAIWRDRERGFLSSQRSIQLHLIQFNTESVLYRHGKHPSIFPKAV